MTVVEWWDRRGGIERSNYEQLWNMNLPFYLHLYWFDSNQPSNWRKRKMGSISFSTRCQQSISFKTMHTFKHGEEITISLRTFLSFYWCTRIHQTVPHTICKISYSLQKFQYEKSRPPLRYTDFKQTNMLEIWYIQEIFANIYKNPRSTKLDNKIYWNLLLPPAMISPHVLFLSVSTEYSCQLLCTSDKTVQTVTIHITQIIKLTPWSMLLMFFFIFSTSTVLQINLNIFWKK